VCVREREREREISGGTHRLALVSHDAVPSLFFFLPWNNVPGFLLLLLLLLLLMEDDATHVRNSKDACFISSW
jgi:hypothetical protein